MTISIPGALQHLAPEEETLTAGSVGRISLNKASGRQR
jgi:hypothetical protein